MEFGLKVTQLPLAQEAIIVQVYRAIIKEAPKLDLTSKSSLGALYRYGTGLPLLTEPPPVSPAPYPASLSQARSSPKPD